MIHGQKNFKLLRHVPVFLRHFQGADKLG